MKAYRDKRLIRQNLGIAVGIGCLLLALAVLVPFFTRGMIAAILTPVCALSALSVFLLVPVLLKRLRDDPAFEIGDADIRIGQQGLSFEEIQHVQVIVRINDRLRLHGTPAVIDRLVLLPPLPNQPGNIVITTLQQRYRFANVLDVMAVFLAFCRKAVHTEAIYVHRGKYMPYVYNLYDPELALVDHYWDQPAAD